MQAIFLSLAISFIKWYLGSGIFDRIETLVLGLVNSEMSNEDKRSTVIAAVKQEYSMIRTRVIDMVIGSVLTKLQGTTA